MQRLAYSTAVIRSPALSGASTREWRSAWGEPREPADSVRPIIKNVVVALLPVQFHRKLELSRIISGGRLPRGSPQLIHG